MNKSVSYSIPLLKYHSPNPNGGLQFFQVGDNIRAAEALRELDDGLRTAYACRDMVDTTTFAKDADGNKTLDGEAMLKFVFGAVDKRRDRQRLSVSR